MVEQPHIHFQDNEEAKKERQQIYVPLMLVERNEEKQRFEHDAFLAQRLAQGQGKTQGKRIALIGEAGAGKTTLLQEIADWVLEQKLGLPVSIYLADLAQAGTLRDFWQYLENEWLGRTVTESNERAKKNFKEQFEQGRVWLLLDGVDEVVTSGGKTLQAIANQLKGWVGNGRVVLTCRLNVWQRQMNALSEFETYRLLDFDYPQQVHQFIDNWFAPSPDKSLEGKRERLKAELYRAERVRIRDLVKNPLRLALLCRTWQQDEGKLPETKARLYGQFVQQFYCWKSERFPISKQKQGELNKALGRLALKDMESGGGRFRLEEGFISEELGDPKDENSLSYLALQLGWLNIVGVAAESTQKKVYAFFHATIEEYFAALAIDDWDFFLPREHKNRPVKGKQYRIFEPRWKQIILLWVGREDVDREQKEQFIKALIEFDDGCGKFSSGIKNVSRGLYEYQAYFIAASSTGEFPHCTKVYEIVDRIVYWCFSGYFSIPLEEVSIATLPETYRSKNIAPLVQILEFAKDENIRLTAAYSIGIIDPFNQKAINFIVEIILSYRSTYSRVKAVDILCNWSKFSHQNLVSLLPIIQNRRDNKSIRKVVEGLGKIGKANQNEIFALVQLLQYYAVEMVKYDIDKETRSKVADSLGKLGTGNKEAIAALLELMTSSENQENRSDGAYNLGKIGRGNQEAIAALVQLLKSARDESTCLLAAYSLGEIGAGNREAIAALAQLLNSARNEITRVQAAESLGKINHGNWEAIAALVQLLKSAQNKYARRLAAYSLGKIGRGNQEAIAALVQLLKSAQDESTCMLAAYSLGKIGAGNREAIAVLVKLLQSNQDAFIRRQAAESLGEIGTGNQEAIAALVQLLQSTRYEDIRRQAVENLEKITTCNMEVQETNMIMLYLNRVYEDNKNLLIDYEMADEYQIVMQAASSLGKIGRGNQEAIAALVQLLQSTQDKYTRRQAASSLGKIDPGNQEAIAALVQLLQSTQDKYTHRQAADILGEIVQDNQKAEVVTALKDCLSAKGYKNNPDRFKKCYELIWDYAQTLPYPEFYQAWHKYEGLSWHKSELLSWHKSELLYLVSRLFQR